MLVSCKIQNIWLVMLHGILWSALWSDLESKLCLCLICMIWDIIPEDTVQCWLDSGLRCEHSLTHINVASVNPVYLDSLELKYEFGKITSLLTFSHMSHGLHPRSNVMSGYFLCCLPNQCYLSISSQLWFPFRSRKWNATLPMKWSWVKHLENVKFSSSFRKPFVL